MAFTNYLDLLPNLTSPSLLIKDRIKYEHPLPLNLSILDFDSSLKHVPTSLKSFMHDYIKHKEIFDLKQRHVSTVESLNNSNKNFFSNNYTVDIFMFTSSVISIISTTVIIYLFCKHQHIRTLVASLILHKIKEVEANPSSKDTNSECKTLAYCYVMQAVVCVSCLGDKCLSHAELMSTALTQLLIFRFSCLLTNKGIAQCIDNSN